MFQKIVLNMGHDVVCKENNSECTRLYAETDNKEVNKLLCTDHISARRKQEGALGDDARVERRISFG